MGFELNREQVFAMYDIENWWKNLPNQVFEVSGSAGTGKTTLIRYAMEMLGIDLEDVVFIAYQGKAAMNMARHGLPAQTIHSLIYNFEKTYEKDDKGMIVVDKNGKPKTTFEFILKKHLDKKIKLIVIDEAGMVPENVAKDILSFRIPVITLGDLNQLPPVFGKPFFLQEPNVILTQIMRQAENDPIVYLAQQILAGKHLDYGVYGKSAVIPKKNLNEFMLRRADMVLTCTNKLRNRVNQTFREDILQYKKLDCPHLGEKVICRKNNWKRCMDKSIFMTNGMSGVIDYIDMSTYNGKTVNFDFKPDFMVKPFKNVTADWQRLMHPVDRKEDAERLDIRTDVFEFAYSITTHLSQGDQYDNVVFLSEHAFDKDTQKKLYYTAITRAIKSITFVI